MSNKKSGSRSGAESDIIQTLQSVYDMPAVANDIVAQYCLSNDIDEQDIYPNVWNDIVTELYIKLFKPCNKLLKLAGGTHNEYDTEKVEYVYKYIYKRLCDRHTQEVSLKGFLTMTGIHAQTIYDWSSGVLSNQRSDLHKIIMSDNEESLEALMRDRRNNPMKILPILNRKHNWNLPGVSRESVGATALSAKDLPKLAQNGQENSLISEKVPDIVVTDAEAQDIDG